jgi:hypothetical protein
VAVQETGVVPSGNELGVPVGTPHSTVAPLTFAVGVGTVTTAPAALVASAVIGANICTCSDSSSTRPPQALKQAMHVTTAQTAKRRADRAAFDSAASVGRTEGVHRSDESREFRGAVDRHARLD